MAADEDCMGYARECVRLAGLTADQELREKLFEIARDWTAAAMDDRYVSNPALTSRQAGPRPHPPKPRCWNTV